MTRPASPTLYVLVCVDVDRTTLLFCAGEMLLDGVSVDDEMVEVVAMAAAGGVFGPNTAVLTANAAAPAAKTPATESVVAIPVFTMGTFPCVMGPP